MIKLKNILQENVNSDNDIQLTRVKSDINGNPRFVVHFLQLLTPEEKDAVPSGLDRIDSLYNLALSKARKIGGRKFHNKQYGGGIVLQGYESNLKDEIRKLVNNQL